MRENLCPVVAGVPANFCRWVNLDGHDLGGGAALNDDDQSPNAAILSAALLAALNVADHEGIPDVGARNYMRGRNGESRNIE